MAGRMQHVPTRRNVTWLKRTWVASLALALAFAGLVPPPVAWANASGIELVSEITQARPTSEAQAQAFDDAMQFAMAFPDDVGYPWIDPASNTLELSAATSMGKEFLSTLLPPMAEAHRVRDVRFSFGQLERIKHEVTTLAAAGVPDADLIYQTAPDHKNGRVIITVSQLSEGLLKDLATRYGTEAIAVQVDPDHRRAGTASRDADYSPFWGGAKINVPIGLLLAA